MEIPGSFAQRLKEGETSLTAFLRHFDRWILRFETIGLQNEVAADDSQQKLPDELRLFLAYVLKRNRDLIAGYEDAADTTGYFNEITRFQMHKFTSWDMDFDLVAEFEDRLFIRSEECSM